MLDTVMEKMKTMFYYYSISFMRSCSQQEIKILVKHIFIFSIIVSNTVKLLVILFMINLIAQVNIFKRNIA